MNNRFTRIARIGAAVLSFAASAVLIASSFSASPIVSYASSVLDGIATSCLGVALLLAGARPALAGPLVISSMALIYSSEVYLLCTGRGRWLGFVALTVVLSIWLLTLFGVIKSPQKR